MDRIQDDQILLQRKEQSNLHSGSESEQQNIGNTQIKNTQEQSGKANELINHNLQQNQTALNAEEKASLLEKLNEFSNVFDELSKDAINMDKKLDGNSEKIFIEKLTRRNALVNNMCNEIKLLKSSLNTNENSLWLQARELVQKAADYKDIIAEEDYNLEPWTMLEQHERNFNEVMDSITGDASFTDSKYYSAVRNAIDKYRKKMDTESRAALKQCVEQYIDIRSKSGKKTAFSTEKGARRMGWMLSMRHELSKLEELEERRVTGEPLSVEESKNDEINQENINSGLEQASYEQQNKQEENAGEEIEKEKTEKEEKALQEEKAKKEAEQYKKQVNQPYVIYSSSENNVDNDVENGSSASEIKQKEVEEPVEIDYEYMENEINRLIELVEDKKKAIEGLDKEIEELNNYGQQPAFSEVGKNLSDKESIMNQARLDYLRAYKQEMEADYDAIVNVCDTISAEDYDISTYNYREVYYNQIDEAWQNELHELVQGHKNRFVQASDEYESAKEEYNKWLEAGSIFVHNLHVESMGMESLINKAEKNYTKQIETILHTLWSNEKNMDEVKEIMEVFKKLISLDGYGYVKDEELITELKKHAEDIHTVMNILIQIDEIIREEAAN